MVLNLVELSGHELIRHVVGMMWTGVLQSVWITWSLPRHLMFGLLALHCGRCSQVVSSRGKEWLAFRYVSIDLVVYK